MSIFEWVSRHDQGFASLRRAARTAIIMPAMFAVGDRIIDNPIIATFAAFGSFAMLLLVNFSGSIRERLQAQFALSIVGGILVCLGTLANRFAWLAALAMFLVAFCVLFSSVVSSVLAGATTPLLLAFILPVTFAGSPSTIPDRLAGWGLASVASLIAIALLWPAPNRQEPLRITAIEACRAIAIRLRVDAAYLLGGPDALSADDHDGVVQDADAAARDLQRTFLATPYRPTGLSTAARSIVRLVDEVRWLSNIVDQSPPRPVGMSANTVACQVRIAAAKVLEQGAALLETPMNDAHPLDNAQSELRFALLDMERRTTVDLPIDQFSNQEAPTSGEAPLGEFITALDSSFRAQELTFAVSQIGANVALASAAERRRWIDRLLGRQPAGLSNTLAAFEERAASHLERHSSSLRNSLRGAVALAIAVLVANLSGVEHAFWVVLGTLAVLRSNALNTGQNVARGILGTLVGFIIGGTLVELIGTNTTVLWSILPVAILIAGFAPAAVSFAAGQAAFTVTLVILYNIIQPAGWSVGLVRIEDVAIGFGISLGIGLLFWPRGAAGALGTALGESYECCANYLARSVEFGMGRCDRVMQTSPEPTVEAQQAARAMRRLDDTFRSFLAERGSKPVPLAEITALVTGPSALRLAGDAVLDLWLRASAEDEDRAGARSELIAMSENITSWYESFAGALGSASQIPAPLERDLKANTRFLNAVGLDLRGLNGGATSTAVRMIWTDDHLDAARRLQETLIAPAIAAATTLALNRAFELRSGNRREIPR